MKFLIKTGFCLLCFVIFYSWDGYAQNSSENISYISSITQEIKAPLRMAQDASGNLYVTDAYNHTISKYNSEGNFIESISNTVDLPVSVAVDNEGGLFIGDGATGQILKYNQNGTATEFYPGTRYPNSMVFSQDNILYVADSKLKQVIALDISGNVVQTIGNEILDFPTGIAVDNRSKKLYVAEHGGSGTGFSPLVKIWVFDLQGNLLTSFGEHGNGDGQFYRIQGITTGKCGNIYAVDPFLGRVNVFDENGVFLTAFGEWGSKLGELNVPMDIIFDSKQRILISSMNNGSVEVFSVSDTLPSSHIISGNEAICSGETTDIEIVFTGTAPWNFTYTIDGLTPTTISTSENPYKLTVSESGLYEVTALSDANYTGTCFAGSAEITVNEDPPTAIVSGDATICEGDTAEISVAFTGSPPWSFTYTTNGENPTSITTVNNPHILNFTAAGLYEVTSLEGGGCTGSTISGSAEIFINQKPTATIANESKQIEIEPGETTNLILNLSGTAPWTIRYTIDDGDPVILENITDSPFNFEISRGGMYEIIEVYDALCTNPEYAGYLDVVVKSDYVFPTSFMNSQSQLICEGQTATISVSFKGTPPWTFTYRVDTLMTTTIFNTYTNPYIINAPYEGIYEVIALSDSVLTGFDFLGNNIVSLNPTPVSDFNHTENGLDVTFSNNSINSDSYLWDFGDGNSSNEINPFHQYAESGDYTVTLTSTNSLCGQSTIQKTLNVIAVSVSETDLNEMFKVYPNPSAGEINVEFNQPGNGEINLEIFNAMGQKVFIKKYEDRLIKDHIDLGSNASGLYFVKLHSREFSRTVRLILK